MDSIPSSMRARRASAVHYRGEYCQTVSRSRNSTPGTVSRMTLMAHTIVMWRQDRVNIRPGDMPLNDGANTR
jgi:hypothetical protein